MMRITVISFGSNWWARFGRDLTGPLPIYPACSVLQFDWPAIGKQGSALLDRAWPAPL